VRAYTPTPAKLGYRKPDAAEFLGLSVSKFDEMVKDGRLPQPFSIDGCKVWDVYDLDAAFEALKVPQKVLELDRI